MVAFDRMPLYFIENRGQIDASAAYYVDAQARRIFFSTRGLTFDIADTSARYARRALNLDFLDANPGVTLEARNPGTATVSYFTGQQSQWKTGLATYSTLVYEELWPGIDLVYSGRSTGLKYSFLVKPGADPAHIKLAYRGNATLSVNGAGQLEVITPAGSFHDDRPHAYQDVDGQQVKVDTGYELNPNAADPQVFGFRVGTYDKGRTLVLDPLITAYSGFIGGSGTDRALGVAVDASGNAYVTGATDSLNFPLAGALDSSLGDAGDAFLAKLTPDGTLVYATYIGGRGNDIGFGVAVDRQGNAFITGTTGSAQDSFPVTGGPDLTYNGGDLDAFVAKVNSSGTALVYSGYIGGSGREGGVSIAVDSDGSAYVTGATTSTQASFPVRGGPDLTFNGGIFFGDAFVAKVNAAGNALDYCGYIGGSGEEAGTGLALDTSGHAYVSGATTSTETTFPVKTGPDLTYNGGIRDGFVAEVDATGSELVYAGYIGGSSGDTAFGIAVDDAGNAYVAGETSSPETSFPVRTGPDLTYNGDGDAFVAKVNGSGSALVFSGYIGGAGRDTATSIAVDGAGNSYLTGQTVSAESTFPVAAGPDLTFNGGGFLGDAFAAMVNSSGTRLEYCGYIGGIDDDIGNRTAIDSSGNVYVVGETSSNDLPVSGLADPTYNGGFRDGFVVKLSVNSPPTAAAGGPYSVAEGASVVLTARGSDAEDTTLSYAWDLNGDGTFETTGAIVTFSAADLDGPSARLVRVRATDSGGLSATADATITVVNVAPSVGPIAWTTSIDPAAVKTQVTANASFTDPALVDTHTARWDWGDGTTSPGTVTVSSRTASGTHTYTAAGLYTVTLTVTDDDGGSGTRIFATVVVVNPGATGTVSGSGTVASPAGAYPANPVLAGSATFTISARYARNATVPSGTSSFIYTPAGLSYSSNSYSWLITAGGGRAWYRGTGMVTINGVSEPATVLVAGVDGPNFTTDRLRVQISTATRIVYDSQPGAPDSADATPIVTSGPASIVVR